MRTRRIGSRARTTTLSLAISLTLSTALSTTARATEKPVVRKLEAGTAIQPPGGQVELLAEPRWLLNRPAVERAIVEEADRRACADELARCEKRSTPAPAGFWASTAGKVTLGVIGGLVFAGGVELGTRL